MYVTNNDDKNHIWRGACPLGAGIPFADNSAEICKLTWKPSSLQLVATDRQSNRRGRTSHSFHLVRRSSIIDAVLSKVVVQGREFVQIRIDSAEGTSWKGRAFWGSMPKMRQSRVKAPANGLLPQGQESKAGRNGEEAR